MSIAVLEVNLRNKSGKGHSRKLRKDGQTPAVIYTKANQALSISLNPKDAAKIFLGPLRRNVLVEIKVKGDDLKNAPKTVMLKERQIHPVQRTLIHMDFIEVNPKEPVAIKVPVETFGKCEAVVQGGKLEVVKPYINISCLPTIIPEKISVDITNFSFGSTFYNKIPLPEGISLKEPAKAVFATIKRPRGSKEEEAAQAPAAAGQAPAKSNEKANK